jgi:ATP-binding cassette subfamily F protein 3
LLSLHNISKQYGGDYLFSDIYLHIGDRERIAIVGSNGSGKSTLLKIITGQVEAESGKISISRAHSVAYLPQDGIHHSGKTLYREIESALDDILSLQQKIQEISLEISRCPEGERSQVLTEELGELQHQLEYRQGYNVDARIKQIASGLGFSILDLDRQSHEFSGGWQMRIELAKLLLRSPSFLLLDEPTNHLDIASLEWLENYLQNYEGTIIVVSHDKRFLDNLVKRTFEISLGKITEYRGNYSFYVEKKAERQALLQAQYESQQKTIERTSRFVERFRYKATKARQVQSRLKMLEKMEAVVPEGFEDEIHFDFPSPPSSGRVLLELEQVAKSYGTVPVFQDATLRIERGDRIAVLGSNGAGKSTLARIIAGTEGFQSGTRKLGQGAAIGYYAQDQSEILNGAKTVLQIVEEAAPGMATARLRALLGCFLFEGDDVFKPVSVLSGGEKSRLALARMLLIPSNLLVLDEPTNHLDIQSKEILQDALSNYNGSYVIVSHDRDFLEPLIEKVLDFRDGILQLTLGSVENFLEKCHAEQTELAAGQNQPEAGKKNQNLEKVRKREEAEKRQTLFRKLKPLQDKLKGIESEIGSSEKRKAELETALADTETYKNESNARALGAEYKDIQIRLESLYDEWASLQEEIESAAKE